MIFLYLVFSLFSINNAKVIKYIHNILILKHHNTYTYFDKQEINPTRNRNSFLYQDFHFFPILKSLKDLFNRLNMNSPNKKN